MATDKSGGNRGGNRRRGGRNNNPEGPNQYSGVTGRARENPLAAAVGGAVAAGVFLWSRRNQISDQIANLADQISEWRDGMSSEGQFETENSRSGEPFVAVSGARRRRPRSQTEIAEEALTLKETGEPA